MEFYSFYGHRHQFMVVLIFTDLLIQDISNVIGFKMVQVMRNCYILSVGFFFNVSILRKRFHIWIFSILRQS